MKTTKDCIAKLIQLGIKVSVSHGMHQHPDDLAQTCLVSLMRLILSLSSLIRMPLCHSKDALGTHHTPPALPSYAILKTKMAFGRLDRDADNSRLQLS
jgi:hypothetical protein